MSELIGAVPWVRTEDGAPRIEARECVHCKAKLVKPSLACPSCGSREVPRTIVVSGRGRLHSFSIVHRSFPGVPTPFISAIVDMDDGVVLKGNLRGVAASPEAIRFDMPVRVVFNEAGPDAAGQRYLAYFFEAA